MSIAHPQGVDYVQQMLSKYAPFIVKEPAQDQEMRLSVEVVDTLGDSKHEQAYMRPRYIPRVMAII